jgi:hypothetical protein
MPDVEIFEGAIIRAQHSQLAHHKDLWGSIEFIQPAGNSYPYTVRYIDKCNRNTTTIFKRSEIVLETFHGTGPISLSS